MRLPQLTTMLKRNAPLRSPSPARRFRRARMQVATNVLRMMIQYSSSPTLIPAVGAVHTLREGGVAVLSVPSASSVTILMVVGS